MQALAADTELSSKEKRNDLIKSLSLSVISCIEYFTLFIEIISRLNITNYVIYRFTHFITPWAVAKSGTAS